MQCNGCEKCKLFIDKLGYTEAKCIARSRRRKSIVWTHTVYDSSGNFIVNGKDRVLKWLEEKNTPFWCPQKTILKRGD